MAMYGLETITPFKLTSLLFSGREFARVVNQVSQVSAHWKLNDQ